MPSTTSLESHPASSPSAPIIPHPDTKSTKSTKSLKRIIVCCDGTWQDGLVLKERWKYTNVLRLSRCIRHQDTRHDPPIPQIVFYQSGIGSENNPYSYLEGATGATLADKVQEAYAFIAQNYHSGDEIFLFGFSRGAYTARMVAMFISAIGVLNSAEMDNFAEIFVNFQKRGKANNQEEIDALERTLAPWTAADSPGKIRTASSVDSFSVKCVGVFDTVGSLGLPEELCFQSKNVTNIFGFPDRILSPDIAHAFQALAINETRADFNCCKFEQTPEGRNRKQVLKQCWFAGSHSDIGGGWESHDLSDLTLTWMAAHIVDMLALNLEYLASLPSPVAPWGQQQPHDPKTGIFILAHEITRQLPTSCDDITHETIHPSVTAQSNIVPMPEEDILEHPGIVHDLMPLEQELKANWPYNPNDPAMKAYAAKSTEENQTPSILSKLVKIGGTLVAQFGRQIMRNQGGKPIDEKAKFVEETHLGPYLKAVEGA